MLERCLERSELGTRVENSVSRNRHHASPPTPPSTRRAAHERRSSSGAGERDVRARPPRPAESAGERQRQLRARRRHPHVPRARCRSPVQHGVVGVQAGPPGKPTVHDAASAARGTVIARMNGIATRPARTRRRRDRSTPGPGRSVTHLQEPRRAHLAEGPRHQLRVQRGPECDGRHVQACHRSTPRRGPPGGFETERLVRRLDVEQHFTVEVLGDESARPTAWDEAAGWGHVPRVPPLVRPAASATRAPATALAERCGASTHEAWTHLERNRPPRTAARCAQCSEGRIRCAPIHVARR